MATTCSNFRLLCYTFLKMCHRFWKYPLQWWLKIHNSMVSKTSMEKKMFCTYKAIFSQVGSWFREQLERKLFCFNCWLLHWKYTTTTTTTKTIVKVTLSSKIWCGDLHTYLLFSSKVINSTFLKSNYHLKNLRIPDLIHQF